MRLTKNIFMVREILTINFKNIFMVQEILTIMVQQTYHRHSQHSLRGPQAVCTRCAGVGVCAHLLARLPLAQ